MLCSETPETRSGAPPPVPCRRSLSFETNSSKIDNDITGWVSNKIKRSLSIY